MTRATLEEAHEQPKRACQEYPANVPITPPQCWKRLESGKPIPCKPALQDLGASGLEVHHAGFGLAPNPDGHFLGVQTGSGANPPDQRLCPTPERADGAPGA